MRQTIAHAHEVQAADFEVTARQGQQRRVVAALSVLVHGPLPDVRGWFDTDELVGFSLHPDGDL